MKRTLFSMIALVLTIAAGAQTLNVKVGSVTYQFPAEQTGEMTYANGETMTIMGKTFTLADITSMTIDNSEVSDGTIGVSYNGSTAAVADLAVADSQVVLADIDNKKNINPKALTTRFGIFFVYSQQI